MKDAVAAYSQMLGRPFNMRIGINTGPVVAGVIGVRKFIYDLWGDTVNVASRMESHGLPGCIQITEHTYEYLVGTRYQVEERGVIEIKGRGTMLTYLLVGREDRLSPCPVFTKHPQAT
jgi:class 3 adenylate cyclase